eukprot:sb/3465209/
MNQRGCSKPLFISPGKDLDGNGFADIAIGSQDTVVFLRSLPILDVVASIATVTKEFNPMGTPSVLTPDGLKVGLNLQVCFKLPPDSPSPLNISYSLTIDAGHVDTGTARIFAPVPGTKHQSQVYEGSLTVVNGASDPTCSDDIPALSRGPLGFLLDPIVFTLTGGIVDGPDTSFSARKSLNVDLLSAAQLSLPVTSDCPSSTRQCMTDMKIEFGKLSYLGQDKHPLVYGTVEQFTLPLLVTNTGPDTAYGASLYLSIPSSVPLLGPPKCSIDKEKTAENKAGITRYVCPLQTARLKPGTSEISDIQLNIRDITNATAIQINAFVTVQKPSKLVKSAVGEYVTTLENLIDLIVLGGSTQSRIAFNNKYSVSNKVLGYTGPSMRHMVEVSLTDGSLNRYVLIHYQTPDTSC